MLFVVGLGNPGPRFQKTRHNIGFRVVNGFRKTNKLPEFKLSTKFTALILRSAFNQEKFILFKPQTFMNSSGKAVKSLTKNYKLKTKNLFVIHDDIDLPLGKIRISKARGAAGHKGVQSVIDELGTKNFIRFRVGISPKWGKPKRVEKFVLKNFTKKEEEIVKKVIKKTVSALETTLSEGLEKAMSNQ